MPKYTKKIPWLLDLVYRELERILPLIEELEAEYENAKTSDQ